MKIYKVVRQLYDWDNDSTYIIGYYQSKESAIKVLKTELADNWRSKEFKVHKESAKCFDPCYIRESDCQTEYIYIECIKVK